MIDTPAKCPIIPGGHPEVLTEGGPATALQTITGHHEGVRDREPDLGNFLKLSRVELSRALVPRF